MSSSPVAAHKPHLFQVYDSQIITDPRELEVRLAALEPRNIIYISDFDLTLANKTVDNFHYVSLHTDQRAMLGKGSEEFGKLVLLTARGEGSTLRGIFSHTAQRFNAVLASNMGHHVYWDTSVKTDGRERISLADEDAEMKHTQTMQAIDRLLLGVGKKFGMPDDAQYDDGSIDVQINGHGMLTLDRREMCAALVYQGFSNNEQLDLSVKISEEIRGILGDDVRALLAADISRTHMGAIQQRDLTKIYEFVVKGTKDKNMPFQIAPKNIPMDNDANCGYFDFSPAGMSKAVTSVKIMEHAKMAPIVGDKAHFICAGDTKSDLAFMISMFDRYGADRTTCIWVGDDKDCEVIKVERPDMKIYRLPGDQWKSIPEHYRMMGIAMAAPRPGSSSGF